MLNNVSTDPEKQPAGSPGTGASAAGATPDGPAGPRSRMPPEERRRQLIGIGLELLTERPLEAITVDEVARRAGISRGLLFHYFPTKRAFHAAVAAAGVRRLLRAVRPDPEAPPAERLGRTLSAYVAFVERRHGRFAEMVRGSWAADAELAALLAESRETMAGRLLEAAGVAEEPGGAAERGPAGDPLARHAARAWLSFAEQLALDWVAAPSVPRERLVRYLETTFRATVAAADG
jgi:AcrR family transcriptional regulator